MKQLFLTLTLALVGLSTSFAQVGIGTTNPHPSSILDVDVTSLPATEKLGFLPPRMETADRDLINAPDGPATGLVIYNLTTKCLEVNVGTPAVPNWKCLNGSTAAVPCTAPADLVCESATTIGAGDAITSTVTGGTGGDITWAITPTTGVSTTSGSGDSTGSITFSTAGTYTVTFTSTNNSDPAACTPAASVTCTRSITVAAPVFTLDCGSATITGTVDQFVDENGNTTVTVPYTNGDGSAYTSETVNSTGVTGLTATRMSGTLASGNGTLTYTIDGTAGSSGSAIFQITLGGESCNFIVPVVAATTTSPPAVIPIPDACLGASAQLISPVVRIIDGVNRVFYYLDRDGDGLGMNGGTRDTDDFISQGGTCGLQAIFNGGNRIVDEFDGGSITQRTTVINGITVRLPSLDGDFTPVLPGTTREYDGTPVFSPTQNNTTYDGLSAIWDVRNAWPVIDNTWADATYHSSTTNNNTALWTFNMRSGGIGNGGVQTVGALVNQWVALEVVF